MRYATPIVSLLIIIAVLIPGKDLPDVNIGGYDKIIHMAMFAVWGVAVRYDFNARPFNFLLVFLAGISFSALTEILQLLVEGRSFDLYDMAADAIGLIVGLMAGKSVLSWIDRVK
jgi:VanZ family protein